MARIGQVEFAFWTTRTERLFAQLVGERVLVIAVSFARNLGSALVLVKEPKWCALPELPIPVEAHWWCRLWKL